GSGATPCTLPSAMAPGGPIGGSTRKEVSGARSWSPTASRRACTTPSPTRRPTRPTQAMSGASRLHGGPGVSGAAAVAVPAAPSNRTDDARRSAVRPLGPREVLLAAQLSHPHIVPLFEAD